MNTATEADFKEGAILICKQGGHEFRISKKYADGIWETKNENVVFECEASCYYVAK